MKKEKINVFEIGDCKILQSEMAMKVSTDSILLAKYCKNLQYTNVLEIGCGIGLITILLHKNNAKATFHGIDIQPCAVQLAKKSLELNRIISNVKFNVIDIQDFSSESKFDLIVSNPPYFVNQLNSSNIIRNEFRHSDRSFISSFAKQSKNLCLQEHANIVIIIPTQMESIWSQEMSQMGFVQNELVDLKYKQEYESTLVICKYSLANIGFRRREWIYGREIW